MLYLSCRLVNINQLEVLVEGKKILDRHSRCQFGLESSILLILHGEQSFLKLSAHRGATVL